MGFKSILGKIGKVALTAAPYVAAPFTGGASLMATGLANKAVSKWSESDAKKAVAKGLAPSKFDQRLGQIGNIAGMASMFVPGGQLGALGKAGGVAGSVAKTAGAANTAMKGGSILGNVMKGVNTGSQILGAARGGGSTPPYIDESGAFGKGGGGWQQTVGNIVNAIGKNRSSGQPTASQSQTRTTGIGPTTAPTGNAVIPGGAMPRGGFRYSENPMNQYDQSNPNLATSIFQGRQEAIKNQPFRRGYDVKTITDYDDQDQPIYSTSRMPRITSGRPDQRRRAG